MLMCITFAVFSMFALFGAFFSAQDGAWASTFGYIAFAFLMGRFSLRAYREHRAGPKTNPPSDKAP